MRKKVNSAKQGYFVRIASPEDIRCELVVWEGLRRRPDGGKVTAGRLRRLRKCYEDAVAAGVLLRSVLKRADRIVNG